MSEWVGGGGEGCSMILRFCVVLCVMCFFACFVCFVCSPSKGGTVNRHNTTDTAHGRAKEPSDCRATTGQLRPSPPHSLTLTAMSSSVPVMPALMSDLSFFAKPSGPPKRTWNRSMPCVPRSAISSTSWGSRQPNPPGPCVLISVMELSLKSVSATVPSLLVEVAAVAAVEVAAPSVAVSSLVTPLRLMVGRRADRTTVTCG